MQNLFLIKQEHVKLPLCWTFTHHSISYSQLLLRRLLFVV